VIRRLLIISFAVLGVLPVSAQYVSRLGRFQVDEKKGCAPFTVTLTNLLAGDCTPGKPCVMDYESNGTQTQNQFTFTYNTPGTFTLSVIYQSIGADDITITVDDNIQPAFEIYTCANNNATIKVTDNHYDQYVIDFNNDNNPETIIPFSNNAVASHSYGVGGNFNIAVRGRDLKSADNCTANVQAFTALASLPTPKIDQLTVVDVSTMQLDFTAAPHLRLNLEVAVNNNSNFQLFQLLYGVSSYTITNLKPDQNYYCFRLSAYDVCNGTNTYSNIICSQQLSLTAESEVNKLSWLTSTSGVSNFSVLRDGGNYVTVPGISFDDTNVICLTNYCYQLVANYGNGSKSRTLQKCVTSFSSRIPTAITNTSAVVGTEGVNLTWLQDPAYTPDTYRIFRSFDRTNFGLAGTSTTPAFSDPVYSDQARFCYVTNYKDVCQNQSPQGSLVCPMVLAGELGKDNSITLNWTRYVGWQNGVRAYSIEKYDLNGTLLRTFSTTDSTLVDSTPDTINQRVTYVIHAQSNQAGLQQSVSNSITITKEAHLFAPTAFTPNHDRLNDSFKVFGQFIVSMHLQIFDRWGTLLYFSDKNKPWDGKRDGVVMPEATYIWKAEITDQAGQHFTRTGTVALLSK